MRSILRSLAAVLSVASFLALGALPVRGQANPPQAPAAPPAADAPPAAAADLPSGPIQVADIVEIRVLGQPEMSGRFRVGSDGSITLPLAGPIIIKDKLPTEAAATITRVLQDGKLLKRPQVTVYIDARPARTVFVSGAISNSGRALIKENSRLSDILEPAGLGPNSDLTKVVITRGGTQVPVNYQKFKLGEEDSLAVNPPLQDGDKIYVYSVVVPGGVVRVNGEVRQPQQLSLTAGTTAAQALQQVGGVTNYADRESIFIQRGTTRIPVPLKEIQAGDNSKDIALLDKDEITVPRLEKPKEFTITGAVLAPGPYPLLTRTTMQEALAKARGQVEGARLKDTELIRALPDGTVKMTKIDLTKPEQAGQEVQEGDLIRIPPAKNRPRIDAFSALGALSSLFYIFGRR